MARTASRHPTELELELLKILWRHGPLPGAEIRECLAVQRDLAYTSVMTMLHIMTQKGYVTRRKKGRGYIYRAKASEDDVRNGMLKDMVERVFQGSPLSLAIRLLETQSLSDGEIDQLRCVIDEKK